MLTGASRPRHRADQVPQRSTLADRYRSADPIDLDGATVYPMYSEQLTTPVSALTVTLLSAAPPAGLAAVGIGLSVVDGYIDLEDRRLAGVDIWRDALERGITFDVAAQTADALFALTPVWSDAAGTPRSWSGNYGIVVERTEMGRTVLWCSMGEGPPHFADLVVEVRNTPLDPGPRLFLSSTVPTVSTTTAAEPQTNRHHWVDTDDSTTTDSAPDPDARTDDDLSDHSPAPSPITGGREPTPAGAEPAESSDDRTAPSGDVTTTLPDDLSTALPAEPVTAQHGKAMAALPGELTSPPPDDAAPEPTRVSTSSSVHDTATWSLTDIPVPVESTESDRVSGTDSDEFPQLPRTGDFPVPAVPAVSTPGNSRPRHLTTVSQPIPRVLTTEPDSSESPTGTSDPFPAVSDTSAAGYDSAAIDIPRAGIAVAPDPPPHSGIDTDAGDTASDSLFDPADEPDDVQGYPCSFAGVRLSEPFPPDAFDTADVEVTAPQRALAEGYAGYDDPLTDTNVDLRYASDTDGLVPPESGRHGWVDNPELTGLVPIVRDVERIDYGLEPPRSAAVEAESTASRHRAPLLTGDRLGEAGHGDRALVDTLADELLAPVPADEQRVADDATDPDRLYSLGAIAHAQGDDERAQLLWTRAARAGHLSANYDLGALSLRYNDPDAAERWWRAAAARRMIPAMADLAVLLEQRGAVAEARMWRTQAVAEEVIATATRRPDARGTLTDMA